jgi:hypothetical protein
MLVVAALACCAAASAKAPVTMSFHSRPDLTPPVVVVTTRTAAVAPGLVFVAPKKGAVQKGPEIVDNRGQPVWFNPVPAQATDFRVQRYRGKPVLTWWEGPVAAPVRGSGVGHGVIMDASYRRLARIDSAFGRDTADLHEFLLTPRGTALLTVYRIVPRDLSSVGGPRKGRAVDSIVQEIDVATGRPVFTWHSLGHVALSESYTPAPTGEGKHGDDPYDYFHLNSIAEDRNGNLLLSARNTHAVYEIDRRTGAVLWRLGGKRSSFQMGRGTRFSWQHDARRQADGTITIFDDGAAPVLEQRSRAIRIRLDPAKRTATLVKADVSPAGILARSQGNMQVLPDGHVLVGWGSVPRVTEFGEDGRVVFDATLPPHDDSYRAYRFRWSGKPAGRPAIAVAAGNGGASTVYASWNGDTRTASWRVVGGINADHLRAVGAAAPRKGFETAIGVRTTSPLLAVQALDAHGRVLATSAAVRRGGLAIG